MGVFDIVGPIMIGPSSSHTAGAARLGKLARTILGEEPAAATIILYGSFARTYRGHGTDKALIGGLLNYAADNPLIKQSYNLAQEAGIAIVFQPSDREVAHPNTVEFQLRGKSGKTSVITGMSIGGGQIIVSQIDGFPVELTGDYPSLITIHMDTPGVIANVTHTLAEAGINIAQMKVSRQLRGADALMILETDQAIPTPVIDVIRAMTAIKIAMAIPPL
ncbi:MAG TPA: L-serine ammonia-lyase, iron-sulfur-dependent subunit beta [Patescibacteria group bacterium]|nr:L-serine ammonia-lyase, iron-sulfur-dependent subunit beta [Patescibacteria group bacterium]